MKQPESIILAFSQVINDGLKHLNPELQKIRNVLKDAEAKNLLNIIEHNGVTYNSLSFLLNSAKGNNVTMLHYSGHSSRNGLQVQSHDESGLVSKKPLSNLIKAHKKFRFIFLNSCYSREIAQELVNAGVPYVIGTSDKVKDGIAAVVATKFYSLLAMSNKTVEEAFLLTKDYIDDPMNNDDADHKEAFRTFQLFDETKGEYPWQLYQSAALKDKDKNWVLIHKKKSMTPYLIGAIGFILLLLVLFNRDKILTNKFDTTKTLDTSHSIIDAALRNKSHDSAVFTDTQNKNKAATHLSSVDNSAKKQAPGKRPPFAIEQPVIKQAAPNFNLLNGASFEQLSSTDILTLTVSMDRLNFSGKLAEYLVSGKLTLLNDMNFRIVSSVISGELTFVNKERITGNIIIKETHSPYTVELTRKKE